MKTQFIGPKKVMGIVKTEIKTPMGSEVIEVTYEKENSEIMTKKSFDLFVTENPIDYTSLRDIQTRIILEDVMKVITEYDIKNNDIPNFIQEFANKFTDCFSRATNFLWTEDDKSWVPGINSIGERTLLEANEIIKKIGKGKGKNK